MRLRLATVLVALPVLALAACGTDTSNDVAEGDESWSFESGNGETVTVDHVPERIIASGAEAAALMSYGIKPVGVYLNSKPEDDPNLKGMDLSGIEILGTEYGKINVEKAATLDPDLIVADWWPAEDAYSGMEASVDKASLGLKKLAPFVGIEQGDSIQELAQGYEDLAESLGADMDAPEVAANREEFNTALAKFEKATAAKPDLTVLAVSPADDVLYVSNPKYAPELQDFQKWGLDVINPDEPDPGFPYWENLSWENADKYQPDLLMIDGRTYEPSIKTGERQPTWDTITAGKEKAYMYWPAYWMHSYKDLAGQLDSMADAIDAADEDLVG